MALWKLFFEHLTIVHQNHVPLCVHALPLFSFSNAPQSIVYPLAESLAYDSEKFDKTFRLWKEIEADSQSGNAETQIYKDETAQSGFEEVSQTGQINTSRGIVHPCATLFLYPLCLLINQYISNVRRRQQWSSFFGFSHILPSHFRCLDRRASVPHVSLHPSHKYFQNSINTDSNNESAHMVCT